MTCKPTCKKDIKCVAALPSVICLELVKDTDTTFEFTLTDNDLTPVDITADIVRFSIYDKIGGTVKIEKENWSGQHIDPVKGKTLFTIERTDIVETLTYQTTTWVYEIRRIKSDSTEAVHLKGDFIIHLSVGG